MTTRANYNPENISDDEVDLSFRQKTRNNFNYIQLALNAFQSSVSRTLDEIKTTIIKSGTYSQGTYTATLTGCTTSPTVTVSYVKIGKHVSIDHPSLLGTSNTTACTITGLPSHLIPATRKNITVSTVLDNSLNRPGEAQIDVTGIITLFFYSTLTSETTTFTNAGTKGLGNSSLSYTLL